MAGLKGRVETEIEIKGTADQFYNIFKTTPHHVPKITGDNIHGVDHEGDWQSHGHGSIKVWKYAVEDEVGTFREKVAFEDETRTVTLAGIEGEHVFKKYKAFTPIYQALPKDEGCFVRLAIEYEKRNRNIPAPTKYIGLMINITKDIGAHLGKA